MKRQKKNIGSMRVSGRDPWYDPDLLINEEDSALYGKISEYFRGEMDIEDVRCDPAFLLTKDYASIIIREHQNGASADREIENFIRESLNGKRDEDEMQNEVSEIKDEINRTNLNEVSSEWIKEWNEKSRGNGEQNAKRDEIRKFITGSLKQEKEISETKPGDSLKAGLSRFLNLRYVSLAAALLTGAVFLIRSLFPSYDADKIFNKYYEPLSAVSAVTRSPGSSGNENFYSAIESYKNGEYKVAESGFSEEILKEPSFLLPRFFLGITQIALGNYNQAIDQLEVVATSSGEYTKEANWYLGLACIKTGNKIKAIKCFESLSRSPGFYKDRSEKILRRLK
jgi:TolA-binding protein